MHHCGRSRAFIMANTQHFAKIEDCVGHCASQDVVDANSKHLSVQTCGHRAPAPHARRSSSNTRAPRGVTNPCTMIADRDGPARRILRRSCVRTTFCVPTVRAAPLSTIGYSTTRPCTRVYCPPTATTLGRVRAVVEHEREPRRSYDVNLLQCLEMENILSLYSMHWWME